MPLGEQTNNDVSRRYDDRPPKVSSSPRLHIPTQGEFRLLHSLFLSGQCNRARTGGARFSSVILIDVAGLGALTLVRLATRT